MHIAQWLQSKYNEQNNNKEGEKQNDDWLWAFERCNFSETTLRRGDCARFVLNKVQKFYSKI